MNKKSILNIHLFSGVSDITGNKHDPFVNCFYTPLLSILKYYKLSIAPVVTSICFLYEIVNRDVFPSGYLRVKNELLFDLKTTLTKARIDMIRETPKIEEILYFIKQCIDNNSPVYVYIDMYYQKGRDAYYQKNHNGEHGILVYGYDDFEGKVHFIDDVYGYDLYEMSYDELFIYYEGLLKYCRKSYSEENTVFVFKNVSNDFNNNEIKISNTITEFSKAMIDKKDYIINGYDELIVFENIQNVVENNESEFLALTSILHRKQSENYQYRFLASCGFYLLDYEPVMSSLLNKIVADWAKIRNIIARDIYKNTGYTKETQESVVKYLREILEAEKILDSYRFPLLEKWSCL